MRCLSAISLSLTLAVPLSAQVINSVTFVPNNITECDLVVITVHGSIPQNATLDNFQFEQVGNTIHITMVSSGSGGPATPYNQAIPALGPYTPGSYTFNFDQLHNGTVTDSFTATKTVTAGATPDPGAYAEHDVCSAGPNISLITQLGGTPAQGGVWTDPSSNVVANGQFVPGVSPQGLYTYSFDLQPPCHDTLQQLFLTYLPNGNPGVGTTLQVCNGPAPAINLFEHLTGNPDIDGTWSPALPGGHLGTYTPGTNNPGTYSYTVSAVVPCPAPHSTVVVQGTPPPNAGNGATAIICETDTSINLNNLITGEANTGAWYESGGFFIGPFGQHISALVYPEGTYYYIVTSFTCPNDTAALVLDYQSAPCFIGIDEMQGNVSRFELLPNPASDQVIVEFELAKAENGALMEVMDVNGQVFRKETLTMNGTLSRHNLDVSALSKGAYLVRITTAEGSATRRLMVR